MALRHVRVTRLAYPAEDQGNKHFLYGFYERQLLRQVLPRHAPPPSRTHSRAGASMCAAKMSRRYEPWISYILNRVRVGWAEGRGQPHQARGLVRRGGERVRRPGCPRRPGPASL